MIRKRATPSLVLIRLFHLSSSDQHADLSPFLSLPLSQGIDYVQERLGQGDQNNETSANQAQDELIAGQIRSQFKERTGQDFPIKDGMGAQEK